MSLVCGRQDGSTSIDAHRRAVLVARVYHACRALARARIRKDCLSSTHAQRVPDEASHIIDPEARALQLAHATFPARFSEGERVAIEAGSIDIVSMRPGSCATSKFGQTHWQSG